MSLMPGFEVSWYFDGAFNATPIFFDSKRANKEFRR